MMTKTWRNYPFSDALAVQLPFTGELKAIHPMCTHAVPKPIRCGDWLVLTPRSCYTEVEILTTAEVEMRANSPMAQANLVSRKKKS